MRGALFALPCPACGSTTELVARETIVCNRCDRSYLVKFGHLIEITRPDGHLARMQHRTAYSGSRRPRA